ncbi:CRISPR-associated protein Cas4 [Actinocatenispora rupis]|uniref:CRISPR-associated exonuclease Cas4 n=1 Tax=Actinocatenispora rupis TaxID=519421 RepID=A0A8J3IWY8_9ACTN|nr:CRISPR-associated protein Cas4 [Actinocatenispora rupis]GID10185.1 CRISPR-associated protein Cas4 [Actinocatenispora rupis]
MSVPNSTSAGGELLSVPLSALEHYAYCDRQAALIHVERAWADSVDTLRGDVSHRVVDLPGLRRRAGVTIVRSLPVWSTQHGLHGVCDVVEFRGDTAMPVEYKVGRYHDAGAAQLQVAAQALCLHEAGFNVPRAAIYSVAEHRRHPVELTDDLYDTVVAAAEALRDILRSHTIPAARNDTRCRRCSLRDDCMPGLPGRSPTATTNLFTPRPLGRWND